MENDHGKVYLTRRVMLCAAHRLNSNLLSEEENQKLYGKCAHANGHGHNYVIRVTVCGYADPVTGMVMDAAKLKSYMEEAIMKPMDHKCIDKDVEYFKNRPSTVENITIFVWESMALFLCNEKCSLFEVKVEETENISAVYRGK